MSPVAPAVSLAGDDVPVDEPARGQLVALLTAAGLCNDATLPIASGMRTTDWTGRPDGAGFAGGRGIVPHWSALSPTASPGKVGIYERGVGPMVYYGA